MLTKIMAFSLLLFMASINTSVYADGKGSACQRTAWYMFQSCQAELIEEKFEAVANCINVEDRRECIKEARAELKENTGECRDVQEARHDACHILDERAYRLDPLLDPDIEFIDPDDVPDMYAPNPYVSIEAGHTYVLRAGEEEEELVVVHVTDEAREIQDVLCRVVVDIVVEVSSEDGPTEYEVVEVTQDWFAQDETGNVYYCGEIAQNFEDGVLRDLEGSFESGRDFAKAGILIKAFPMVGKAHRSEFLLGDAEDIVRYEDLATNPTAEEGGENPAFPCGMTGCLKTFDFAPIDPESTEYKYYLPGTGFVLAVAMEDGEIDGEREELVCTGDSLDVLETPACGIDELPELLDLLCTFSPESFCEE